MRYLDRRDDFLIKHKRNEAFDMSGSGSGPVGNDIAWGDSLVGRLINSAIRTTKIKYNATKVDTLLKDFKAQLDIILAESLSRDTRSEFLKLTIKSLLNDVDRTCTSTQDEKEKIEALLGTDDGNSLWDPKKPNRGSFTENVDDGILLKIHDKIKLDLDEKQIEIAGIKKDDILASLSELIDDLREYAWLLDNSGQASSQTRNTSTFAVKFWGLLGRTRKKKKPEPQNDSHSFRLKGYYDFIKESNELNSNKLIKNIINILINMYNVYINDKERNVKTIESISQKNTEDLLLSIFSLIEKQSDSFKNFNYDKLYQSILHIHKKSEDSSKSELANMIYFLYKNGNVNDIDKGGKLKNSDSLKKLFTSFKSSMDNLIKISEKSKDDDKQQNIVSSEKDTSSDYINQLLSIEGPNNEKIQEIVDKIPTEKKKEILNSILNDKESNDVDRKEAKELLSELEDAKNESLMIKESISSNDTTVNEIWRKWIKDADIPEELITVSQQEIDKLEEMINGEKSGQNLMFNPKKTPDPIINIVRIFKRAHDLYYTDVIPSGRSGGKVSNKTFREYEKLGTGKTSPGDANAPGYGPWAVKSIRNKWVDGVMQIIEDQEYRKVFANTKFVVTGSEDTFNNENISYSKYINLILEKEEESRSQGQILFDFITDMLSKETASNFDKERNTLLKKYFGSSVEIKESDMKKVNRRTTPDKPRDPVEDKTLYWEQISQKGIDTSYISDGGPVIMFPYKDGEDILKFQIISEINTDDSKGKPIKGYAIEIFNNVKDTEFYKKNYKSFKIGNDDEVGKFDPSRNIAVLFPGSIDGSNIKDGKKFKIIFYDNNKSDIFNNNGNEVFDITVYSKSTKKNTVPSVLWKKESGKPSQVKVKYSPASGVVINKIEAKFLEKLKKI